MEILAWSATVCKIDQEGAESMRPGVFRPMAGTGRVDFIFPWRGNCGWLIEVRGTIGRDVRDGDVGAGCHRGVEGWVLCGEGVAAVAC